MVGFGKVDKVIGEAAFLLKTGFWDKLTPEGKASVSTVIECYLKNRECDHRDTALVAKLMDSFGAGVIM